MTDPKPPIITGEGIEDPTEMQDETLNTGQQGV